MINEAEIYHECNEHLKESDKKRDQVIGFYIVLLGLLLSNYDKLVNHRNLALGIFGLLGIFLIAVVIQYRKWHISYVRASQAVTIFSIINDDNSQNRIDTSINILIKNGYMSKRHNWFNPFNSTEAVIFFIVIGSSFIPTQLFIIETGIGLISLPLKWSFILNLLAYYAISITMCFFVLRKEIQKDPFQNWLLYPIVLASLQEEQPSSKSSSHNQTNAGDGKSHSPD